MSDKNPKNFSIFSLLLCILGAIVINLLVFVIWSSLSVSASDMNPLVVTLMISGINLVSCPLLFLFLKRRHIRILLAIYSFLSAGIAAALIFPIYTFCLDRYGDFGAHSIIPLLIIFLTGCTCTGFFTIIIRGSRQKESKPAKKESKSDIDSAV